MIEWSRKRADAETKRLSIQKYIRITLWSDYRPTLLQTSVLVRRSVIQDPNLHWTRDHHCSPK